MRNFRKHTGSQAKTRSSRSSRPARFGYGMTGVSLITILTMQAVKSDLVVSEDVVEDTVSVSEDVVSEDTVSVSEDVVDLNAMSKAELLAHAEELGIKVFKSWNKSKIIETLSV